MNLAALLFDIARRQPEAAAVSDSIQAWSYREFAHRISCLAGGLTARGLHSGDRLLVQGVNKVRVEDKVRAVEVGDTAGGKVAATSLDATAR